MIFKIENIILKSFFKLNESNEHVLVLWMNIFFNITSFCFVKLNFFFNFSYFHTSQNNKMKWRCEKPENFNLLSSFFPFLLKKIHFKCVWQEERISTFFLKNPFSMKSFYEKKVFSFKFLFKSVFIRFNQFNRFNYITFNDVVHWIY